VLDFSLIFCTTVFYRAWFCHSGPGRNAEIPQIENRGVRINPIYCTIKVTGPSAQQDPRTQQDSPTLEIAVANMIDSIVAFLRNKKWLHR
jgi:hypothetical protein